MNLIVDASVAVKWYFPEPRASQAHSLLLGTDPLHAPDFLLLEIDNVLCRRMRQKETGIVKAEEIRKAIRAPGLHLHPSQYLLDEAFAIAAGSGCSPYDCLYVALAARLAGRMVTDDQRLCRSLAGSILSRHVLWIGDMA